MAKNVVYPPETEAYKLETKSGLPTVSVQRVVLVRHV